LYTGQVNSFLPSSLIPALATVETVIEGSLGIAMLLGWRTRIAAWGSTLLLLAFFAAMTISLGFASVFPYCVLVMTTGGWVLAVSDASRFSVDRAFEWFAERAVCPTLKKRTFLESRTRFDLDDPVRRKQVILARIMSDVKASDYSRGDGTAKH
jgi:hypothetical protein